LLEHRTALQFAGQSRAVAQIFVQPSGDERYQISVCSVNAS
jgi:hypothetical protein